MEFNFGEKMKSLRKKRALTQETLAEMLGVSSQAVSKWETGAAYPDILMFPAIANFYGVSTDELLGVDVSKTVETVNKVCETADGMFAEKKYSEALSLLRKSAAEFVGYDELNYRLAWALTGNMREHREYLDEAIGIYLKILDTSADTALRAKVTRDLVYRLYTKGDNAAARVFADQLPPFEVCLEYTLGRSNLLEGAELAAYLKNNVKLFGKAIVECLEYMTAYNIISEEQMSPETAESAADKIELMKKVLCF